MTDDLVKRLRETSGKYDEYCWHSDIELEAATRIEQLEYALRSIAEVPFRAEIPDWMDTSDYLGKEAHIHVFGMWEAMRAAATRIEQLQEALQKIVWIATPDHEEARNKATEIARAALGETDD